MKKIIKILFVFVFMIANKEILNAEEVKYRWFKITEEDIHYEYEPEEMCKSFEKVDYDNFVYGEYRYSLIKPSENDGRVITKEVHNLDINRHEINIMQIKKFDMKKELLLTEFEIFDKNGNSLIDKKEDLKIVHVMQRKAPDRESIDYFLICKKYEGKIEIMEKNKCDDVRFFELKKLPENTIPYIRKGIESYLHDEPFSIFGW